MPKAISQKKPYYLSLPSPTGLPLNSTFYRRPSPSTPSRPSLHTPRGLLHDFARAPNPIAKQEDEGASLPIPVFRAGVKGELIFGVSCNVFFVLILLDFQEEPGLAGQGDTDGSIANPAQYITEDLLNGNPCDESADAEGRNVIVPQQAHAPLAPDLAQNAEPVRTHAGMSVLGMTARCSPCA